MEEDPLQQLSVAGANFQEQLTKVQTWRKTPSNFVTLVWKWNMATLQTWGSGLKNWVWVMLMYLIISPCILSAILGHVFEDFHPKILSRLPKHEKCSSNEPSGIKLPPTISESNKAGRWRTHRSKVTCWEKDVWSTVNSEAVSYISMRCVRKVFFFKQ